MPTQFHIPMNTSSIPNKPINAALKASPLDSIKARLHNQFNIVRYCCGSGRAVLK